MRIYIYAFCREFGKMSQYGFLEGSAQIITILHRGGIKIYYNITWGGSSRFITILHWGGSLGTPNLYYVTYGRPLNSRVAGQLGHTAILNTARPPVFAQTPAFKLKIACIFTRIGRRQLPVQRVVNTAFDI